MWKCCRNTRRNVLSPQTVLWRILLSVGGNLYCVQTRMSFSGTCLWLQEELKEKTAENIQFLMVLRITYCALDYKDFGPRTSSSILKQHSIWDTGFSPCFLPWLKGSSELASYSHNRPPRPIGLRDVKDPTLQDSRHTVGGKFVSPKYRPHFTPKKRYFSTFGTYSCLREPQGLVRLEGLRKLKEKSNVPHRVCSIAP
jgi:hypothetical protein